MPQPRGSPSHSGHTVPERPPSAGTDDGFGQPGQCVGCTTALSCGSLHHRGGNRGRGSLFAQLERGRAGSPSKASISQTEACAQDGGGSRGPSPGFRGAGLCGGTGRWPRVQHRGPRLAASARPGSIRQSTRPCAHCPTGQTRVAEAGMGLQALPLPACHPVPQRAAVRLEQRDSKFLGERGVQHTGPPARPRKGLRKCQFISCPPQGCHVALTGHCRWAGSRARPPPLPPPRPRRPPLQAPSAPPSPPPPRQPALTSESAWPQPLAPCPPPRPRLLCRRHTW